MCHPWVRLGDTGSLLREAEKPLLPEAPTVVPLGEGLKPQCLQVAGSITPLASSLSVWPGRGEGTLTKAQEKKCCHHGTGQVPREVT